METALTTGAQATLLKCSLSIVKVQRVKCQNIQNQPEFFVSNYYIRCRCMKNENANSFLLVELLR